MPPVRKVDITEAVAAYKAVAKGAEDMREPNGELAAIGAQAARERAPHRTGRLAAAIEPSADDRAAILAVSVPYARFQEFGTRYLRARRFMAAGRRAMRNAAPEVYRRRMADIVRRAAR